MFIYSPATRGNGRTLLPSTRLAGVEEDAARDRVRKIQTQADNADGCSLPDGSETWVVVRTAGPLVYRKLIAAKTFEPLGFRSFESARRAHHLQNPQNRQWSRVVTGSLIGPLAGWGKWDL